MHSFTIPSNVANQLTTGFEATSFNDRLYNRMTSLCSPENRDMFLCVRL
jgi:hypothetical protein